MLSKGDSGAKIGCPALTGKRWSAVVVEGVTEEVTRVPLYWMRWVMPCWQAWSAVGWVCWWVLGTAPKFLSGIVIWASIFAAKQTKYCKRVVLFFFFIHLSVFIYLFIYFIIIIFKCSTRFIYWFLLYMFFSLILSFAATLLTMPIICSVLLSSYINYSEYGKMCKISTQLLMTWRLRTRPLEICAYDVHSKRSSAPWP